MKDLRDTPTQRSGNRARKFRQPAQQLARLCRRVLAKPIPGSMRDPLAAIPAARPPSIRSASSRGNVRSDVVVVRLGMHRRPACRACASAPPGSRARPPAARQRGHAQSAETSLTMRGAGIERRRHRRGVAGIDRRRAARCGQRADHRQDARAAPLRRSRARRPVGCSRRRHRRCRRPPRPWLCRRRSRCSGIEDAPPSLKLSGVTFSTPMTRARRVQPSRRPVARASRLQPIRQSEAARAPGRSARLRRRPQAARRRRRALAGRPAVGTEARAVLRRRLVHHLADHRLAAQHGADLVAASASRAPAGRAPAGAVPRCSRSGCGAPWHRRGR